MTKITLINQLELSIIEHTALRRTLDPQDRESRAEVDGYITGTRVALDLARKMPDDQSKPGW